jgi:glycosidase
VRPLIVGALAMILLAGCAPREPSPSAAASTIAGEAPTNAEVTAPPCGEPASAEPDSPWWVNRVFYEVFVRSFADGDGDGIGDLAGLTARLDYLNDGDPATRADLGVTGIWLMPVFEAGSYHGYDVLDYEAIEADYGDAAAFDAFLEAAHGRGIRVIVDFVVNHTSADHPWFRDALTGGPHRDWYLWREADPGWLGVAGGSPWHASPSGWYYGAFSERMPDLNLANPAVSAELARIATAWLDAGVDGLRLDAAKHLIETGPDSQVNTPQTRAWLAAFRDTLHAAHPEALVLGEVWEPRAITTSYVADGSLDLVFDFGIGSSILGAIRLGDATSLEAGLGEIAGRYLSGTVATFLTNHDQPRAMTLLRSDLAGAKLAAAALLTGPGVPFVYYGEELGMRGTKPDEQIRTPFPWTSAADGFGFTTSTPWEPFGPDPETMNVERLGADSDSLLSTYRDLVRLRADQPELSTGAVVRLGTSRGDVAATLRWGSAGAAIVVQNLGPDAATNLALALEEGPLCGSPAASIAYATGGAARRTVAPPKVTEAGGLDAWVPVTSIPARSTVVIDLIP